MSRRRNLRVLFLGLSLAGLIVMAYSGGAGAGPADALCQDLATDRVVSDAPAPPAEIVSSDDQLATAGPPAPVLLSAHVFVDDDATIADAGHVVASTPCGPELLFKVDLGVDNGTVFLEPGAISADIVEPGLLEVEY